MSEASFGVSMLQPVSVTSQIQLLVINIRVIRPYVTVYSVINMCPSHEMVIHI